jgi:serine phosphatase RsbU (regulator of sigma subunit)
LDKQRTVVGRHPDCDITVEAPAVSRQHAVISEINGVHYIEDLHSRNGTYVNDQLISTRQRLKDRDKLRICDVVLTFFLRADSTEPIATAVFLDDTDNDHESSIMSKLDVSSSNILPQLAASAEVKLNAILELNKTLARSLALDEVLPQLLESLFTIFVQADRGFIVLRGADGSLQPRWTKYRRDDDTTAARISRTIINGVMESKEALLLADASGDQRFDMAQSITDFSIRSVMCAPLTDSEDNVLGALQLDTLEQRNRFRDEDLGVFVSIASQAGMAIVNAELHEKALERQSLQRELEVAHEVQMRFLPHKPPQITGFDFYGYYRPANQMIGGDYYDYFSLPNNHLATIVADVSGHGIASALLMAKLSADARFCLATLTEPGEVLSQLNELLCEDKATDRFVTTVLVVFDPAVNEFQMAVAGHNPPIMRRHDGRLELIGEDVTGLPLGMQTGHQYQQTRITFAPNDTLVLYTDGIIDAMDRADERYGDDRFRKRIQQTCGLISDVGLDLIGDVQRFTDGESQNDDMCLVCVRRTEP